MAWLTGVCSQHTTTEDGHVCFGRPAAGWAWSSRRARGRERNSFELDSKGPRGKGRGSVGQGSVAAGIKAPTPSAMT